MKMGQKLKKLKGSEVLRLISGNKKKFKVKL